jgi:glycosyltransferase involved in cell wall biosynthesis
MRPTVLHVLEAFAGGTERHLLDLVRHVDGFEHVIAVPSQHHGRSTACAMRAARAAGARVERVEMGRSGAGVLNLSAFLTLRGLIDDLAPAVVHGHSSIGGALARMATATTGVPLVYTPHGLSRARLGTAVERLLGGRIDRFIAVSASERDFALAHGVVRPAQVVVVPNGVALEPPPAPDRSLRERLRIPDGAPLVGCCARLTWQKAPEVFVAAAALANGSLPQAHFVLIGSGPLRRSIGRAVRDAGIWHRFHVVPSLEDCAASLPALDVYALPSRFEGAPYTPLEAMRADVPVIVSDAAGNRDTVQSGVSGLIVPTDDPVRLAEAIVEVVEDRGLRERLVQGGRAELKRFDVRRMAAATRSVYEDVLNERAERDASDRVPLRAARHRGHRAAPVDLGVRTRAPLPRELGRPLDPALRKLVPERRVVAYRADRGGHGRDVAVVDEDASVPDHLDD